MQHPLTTECSEWLTNAPGRYERIREGLRAGVPMWVLSVPEKYQPCVREAVARLEGRK